MKIRITAKRALWLFIAIVTGVMLQATWWIIFMAKLIDEKVEMAKQLGATPEFIAQLHEQEIGRQIMIGSEGVLFLCIIIFGAWLIYRALVQTEALKTRQDNFLLSVTHELKTPLASLRIYLDTLESPKIADDKKVRIIPRMKQDAIRLERMISNILEATKFDHHKNMLDTFESNLSQIVNEAIGDLEGMAEDFPRTVTADIQSNIFAEVDPKAFRRAFDALLENCLKYHDGKQVLIDVKLVQTRNKIILTVKDQGIGFVPKKSETLFDRFYRLGSEMTRSTDGTGLGLYLCREIIRAHGGNVIAKSGGPGKGAKFTIELKRKISS